MGKCFSRPLFGVILAKFLTDKDPKTWFNRNQIDTQHWYDAYKTPGQETAKVTFKFRNYVGKCWLRPHFGVILAKFLTHKDPKNWINRNEIDTQYRYDVYEAADQVSAKVTFKFRNYVRKCCSRPHFGVILAKFLPHKDPKNWFNRNQIDTQYR